MSQRMRAYGETIVDIAVLFAVHLGGGLLGIWQPSAAGWVASIATFALLQANKAIRGVRP